MSNLSANRESISIANKKYLCVIQYIIRKLYAIFPLDNKLALFIAFKVRFQFGSEKVPLLSYGAVNSLPTFLFFVAHIWSLATSWPSADYQNFAARQTKLANELDGNWKEIKQTYVNYSDEARLNKAT